MAAGITVVVYTHAFVGQAVRSLYCVNTLYTSGKAVAEAEA